MRGYDFHYDGLSRLAQADYVEPSHDGDYSEQYWYDLGCNMTRRSRSGSGATALTVHDYDGNRLSSGLGSLASYDACGRLTGAAGLASGIEHNEIGLPSTIRLQGSSQLNVVYAADGRKLSETFVPRLGNRGLARIYSGSCIFTATALSKVLFDGGYVEVTSAARTYMFFLTDHLGSVRVVADENGTVRQVNQYYPYGDLIEDANMIEWMSDNRYRFTGKELATETGLYDFMARYLETSMGRFTTIDPLAEKYPSVSPYAYCAGDSVNRVDPDGRTDYFNNDGRDNGMIKISTSEQIEELKNQN